MEINIGQLLQSERWPLAMNPLLFNKVSNEIFYTNRPALWIDQEDFKPVVSEAIVVFDIIDHVKDEKEFMNKVVACCNYNTEIYIRVHPYTSRLATHNKNNKAFSHFFGIQDKHHNKRISYMDMFRKFDLVKKEIQKQTIEDFFFTPTLKNIIENECRVSMYNDIFNIAFIDYTFKLIQ